MLQEYVHTPIDTAGYPFPLLPSLAIEFLRLGHEVTIVSTGADIASTKEFHGDQLHIYVVPTRSRARARALDFFSVERYGVKKVLREIAPDIIHAHWTYEFAMAAHAARIAPVLVTAHDAPLTILRYMRDPYRAVRALMAYVARSQIKNLTAVSPYLATRWRREMLYLRPITIVPNPVPEVTPVRAAPSLGYPMILDVADASSRKNVKSLIRAFALVRVGVPTAKLHLVGPGLEAEGDIAAWARSEKLVDGVNFMGVLNRIEIAQQYNAANVFCHPSLEESQGVCLLEALSAMVPVVAGSNSGGVAWTLFDGEAGDLVDIRKPREICSAIVKVLVDPEAAALRSTAALELMRTRYSPEVVSRQYLSEYRDLIQNQIPAGAESSGAPSHAHSGAPSHAHSRFKRPWTRRRIEG